MVHYSFDALYNKKDHMRCLDLNGGHPENDALMLVGILTGNHFPESVFYKEVSIMHSVPYIGTSCL